MKTLSVNDFWILHDFSLALIVSNVYTSSVYDHLRDGEKSTEKRVIHSGHTASG